MKRTLYQCANSVVNGSVIVCSQGHPLGRHGQGVNLRRLIRGEELCLPICADCPDFDSLGAIPVKNERGWTPNAYERELVRPNRA